MLLILDIFGLGITILPRRTAEIAGQSGWIAVVIGCLFAMVCVFIIATLASKFHNDNFVDYCIKIVGRPLGILISWGFVIKIIVSLALELRVFSEILKQIMLFSTPFWAISISMLLLGAYAASKGYEARGRIAEILIFVILIPLIIVFSFAISDTDFTNLMPFFEEASGMDFINGGFISLFSFSGIEFVLLAYPYLTRKNKARRKCIYAVGFVGIIMIVITAITIARFGKFDVVHQMWPVLEIMDTINLPGSFIERQDALIMSFWIISIFVVINAGMFFASLLLKNIVQKGTHSTFIVICIPIVYFISFLPSNIAEVYRLMTLVYLTFGAAYLFIIPLFLLIVANIRGLGENIYEKN